MEAMRAVQAQTQMVALAVCMVGAGEREPDSKLKVLRDPVNMWTHILDLAATAAKVPCELSGAVGDPILLTQRTYEHFVGF